LSDSLSPTDIVRRKTELRTTVLARRAALSPAERAAAANALVDRIADLALPETACLVSGFWPIRDEIDVRPLMAAIAARGHRLALPVIGPNRHLSFREWTDGAPLVPAGFGTSEPGPDCPACDPAILLVPLVAFDRQGARLGYGKGHYDGAIRRLADLGPVRTIGVAFATQEVDEVPMEAHDRHLDAVLTEAGFRRFTPLSGEPDARTVSG
jgi:5-formyltetrahydrofolate cyclo-ligase